MFVLLCTLLGSKENQCAIDVLVVSGGAFSSLKIGNSTLLSVNLVMCAPVSIGSPRLQICLLTPMDQALLPKQVILPYGCFSPYGALLCVTLIEIVDTNARVVYAVCALDALPATYPTSRLSGVHRKCLLGNCGD